MNLYQTIQAIRNGMDRCPANYGELKRLIRLAREVDTPTRTFPTLKVSQGHRRMRWAIVTVPCGSFPLTYRFLLLPS
jgi:hypothetical protein